MYVDRRKNDAILCTYFLLICNEVLVYERLSEMNPYW